jgi:hypothetical protein
MNVINAMATQQHAIALPMPIIVGEINPSKVPTAMPDKASLVLVSVYGRSDFLHFSREALGGSEEYFNFRDVSDGLG